MLILQYNPQLVLISSGYDAAIGCPEVEIHTFVHVCVYVYTYRNIYVYIYKAFCMGELLMPLVHFFSGIPV